VAGAGNVADYKFDETSGTTAADSSGNGHDGTVITNPLTVSFGNSAVNDQWWTMVQKKY